VCGSEKAQARGKWILTSRTLRSCKPEGRLETEKEAHSEDEKRD